MKYIVKKSVVDLVAPTGSISDTRNIGNKEVNTYSARIIENLLSESDGTLVAITNEEIDEIIV